MAAALASCFNPAGGAGPRRRRDRAARRLGFRPNHWPPPAAAPAPAPRPGRRKRVFELQRTYYPAKYDTSDYRDYY